MNKIKRLGYYHNKDMDGFFSGAVLKYRYPDIELRGWDYKDPVPEYDEMMNFDEVILIDITFPLDVLIELGTKTKLTVIDHHISFKKQVDEYLSKERKSMTYMCATNQPTLPFEYIFDQNLSACELGMKHYFGSIPPVVKLVGEYDTWRGFGTDEWEKSILPMKYFLYSIVNKPEKVSVDWLILDNKRAETMIFNMINVGKGILKYEDTINESKTETYAFEREAFGLRALCMNTNFFSSEIMKTIFDPEKHDIMIGFAYTGSKWSVSMRSIEGGVDASQIAKERGGGGHKGAARFETEHFENIFK